MHFCNFVSMFVNFKLTMICPSQHGWLWQSTHCRPQSDQFGRRTPRPRARSTGLQGWTWAGRVWKQSHIPNLNFKCVSWQISRCKLVSSYYHSETETVTNHFLFVTRADPKQELEQELVAVSSSFDAGSEEPACLLIIVISLIIVI